MIERGSGDDPAGVVYPARPGVELYVGIRTVRRHPIGETVAVDIDQLWIVDCRAAYRIRHDIHGCEYGGGSSIPCSTIAQICAVGNGAAGVVERLFIIGQAIAIDIPENTRRPTMRGIAFVCEFRNGSTP